MTPGELTQQARAWIADDPSPADRAELADLLAAAGQPGPAGQAALAELADRFAGRLEFGTAGLRGVMGAGPNRMNRAVVRAATMGLARWLLERWPAAAQAGVVLGWDARHRVGRVRRGGGGRAHRGGHPGAPAARASPTPLLAFAVRYLSAAAGVMITASHNPPADNGYKLYLGDGAQIVPPVDAQIEAAIRGLGPLSAAPGGPAGRPAGHPARRRDRRGLPGGHPARRAPPPGAGTGLRVVYTPLHGVAGGLMTRPSSGPVTRHRTWWRPRRSPTRTSRTVSFPNPEEPGALDLALAEAARLGADLVLASDPDGDRLGGGRARPGRRRRLAHAHRRPGRLAARRVPARRHGGRPGSGAAPGRFDRRLLGDAGGHRRRGRVFRYAETLTGFKWIVRAG